jgi:hypothetical protein
MSDLGNMTNGILDNSIDLVEIWKKSPWRRDEFGWRELEDIRRAKEQLACLEGYVAIHMNRKKLKGVA